MYSFIDGTYEQYLNKKSFNFDEFLFDIAGLVTCTADEGTLSGVTNKGLSVIAVSMDGAKAISNFLKGNTVAGIDSSVDFVVDVIGCIGPEGAWDGAVSDVKGLINFGKAVWDDPKQSIKDVYTGIKNEVTSIVSDPKGYAFDKYEGIKQFAEDFMEASPEEQAYMLGEAAEKIGVTIAVSKGTSKIASKLTGAGKVSKAASIPVGRRGSPLEVTRGTNTPTKINGRKYTGHALDQMQGRGFVLSVVEDTIMTGIKTEGNTAGTWAYTTNQAKVIINEAGDVITVGS